jgi:hypothetical protein
MNPITKNYLVPAIFVEESDNAKIRGYKGGKVSTTYASINGSCPDTCNLKATKECYAVLGPTGMHAGRLNESAKGKSPRDIARAERKAIKAAFKGGRIPQDGARGGRDLRLHTAGDAKTPSAVAELAAAENDWRNRGGGDVWTYTHAWRVVPRKFWGNISILASVDSPKDLRKAFKVGYAPAMIVPTHKSPNAVMMKGLRMVPCPAQTKDQIGCADCRMCLDNSLHGRKAGILFAAHGVKRKGLALKVINNA